MLRSVFYFVSKEALKLSVITSYRRQGIWELFVLSTQFHCEFKSVLKSEVCLKGKKVVETTKHTETLRTNCRIA